MRILGRTIQTVVWLIFAVLVTFGSTVYFLGHIISYSAVSIYSVLLWGAALCNVFLIFLILRLITEKNPGLFFLAGKPALFLEAACFFILLAAGLYFRLGAEFYGLWTGEDSAVAQAAMVGTEGAGQAEGLLAGGPVASAYVFLLHKCYQVMGNRGIVAAGMQLFLFLTAGILLYFLIRRAWGRVSAVFVWGCLMLLPDGIRFSMESVPGILPLFGAVLLGWILYGCALGLAGRGRGRRLSVGQAAWLGLVPVLCCAGWSVYVGLKQALLTDGILFPGDGPALWESSLTVLGRGILLLGLAALLAFWLSGERWAAAACMTAAILLLAVQLLGLDGGNICGVLLCVMLSLLAGVTARALLCPQADGGDGETFRKAALKGGRTDPAREKGRPEQDPGLPAGQQGEKARALTDGAGITGYREAGEMEIYIPSSMEIPRRAPRARQDFDREFDESELVYDIEILEDADFDIGD